MTIEEFNKFQDVFLKDVQKIISVKGKEYVRGDPERFANFKRIAQRRRVTALQAASILVTKHLDSIEAYIDGDTNGSVETMRGRFIDVVAYFTLMAGMVSENEGTRVSQLEIADILKNNNYIEIEGTRHHKTCQRISDVSKPCNCGAMKEFASK